jgi:hypothetical protein
LQLVLALGEAVAGELDIAQQLGLGVGRRQQVQAAADLGRRQGGPHLLDFLGEFGAVAIPHRVVFQLGDGRFDLRDLLVIGMNLGVELRLALHVKRLLQLAILHRGRLGGARRRERPASQLRLAAGDLRVEAGDLRFERADIGGGKGRIERPQPALTRWPSCTLSVLMSDGSSACTTMVGWVVTI